MRLKDEKGNTFEKKIQEKPNSNNYFSKSD